MAGLWETSIKVSLGKLIVHEPFDVVVPQQLAANGIEILPIQFPHVAALLHLPLHHGDPFDRLLIAQAKVESLPVLGNDQAWDAYGIERLW